MTLFYTQRKSPDLKVNPGFRNMVSLLITQLLFLLCQLLSF